MTEFTGHASEMSKSPYLASDDLLGRGDVQVEIESVQHYAELVGVSGRKEKDVFTLKFKGKKKEMWINATNRKTLTKMFGPEVAKWKGKKVTLYVQEGVRSPAGGTTNGLRIKLEAQKT